jgi:hypothetical protein
MLIRYRSVVAELIDLARQQGVNEDSVVRQRRAEAVTGSRLLAMALERIMASVLNGEEPGPRHRRRDSYLPPSNNACTNWPSTSLVRHARRGRRSQPQAGRWT